MVALAACTEPGLGDSVISRVERLSWKVEVARELDILFVVDNSPAMAAHQATWLANQRAMMNVLATYPGGLPDVHIGVVTTDLGTLGRDGQVGPAVTGCSARGDNGALRINGAMVQGTFLSDIELANGMRQTNYVGSLADAFATMATVGTHGCSYVQPLATMERALDRNTANAGFLRETAFLAVLFVTPNDDCSFMRGGFAVESASVNAHECATRDTELVDVDHYETLLRSLKADPSKIVVAAITGPADVQVIDGPEGLEVAPSCSVGDARALPAVRLKELIDRFPNRSSFTSICQQNWSDIISGFSPPEATPVGNSCFESMPIDRAPDVEDVQAECAVAYRFPHDERPLRACGTDERVPCWRVVEDPLRCSSDPRLRLDILPDAVRFTDAVRVVADCLVQ